MVLVLPRVSIVSIVVPVADGGVRERGAAGVCQTRGGVTGGAGDGGRARVDAAVGLRC